MKRYADFVVVKTMDEAKALIQNTKNPPKSLEGLPIYVLPNGLEHATKEELMQLPLVKELVRAAKAEGEANRS